MRVIKIRRTVVQGNRANRRSIRHFARDFFAKENHLEFAIEALVFGALLALSAWPIVAAATAINDLLLVRTRQKNIFSVPNVLLILKQMGKYSPAIINRTFSSLARP